jgi:hypothetical protein
MTFRPPWPPERFPIPDARHLQKLMWQYDRASPAGRAEMRDACWRRSVHCRYDFAWGGFGLSLFQEMQRHDRDGQP